MRDRRLARRDQRHVLGPEQHAVREHRARREQAELVEGGRVAQPRPALHVRVLPVALRAKRLDMAVATSRERAKAFEQRVGAGRDEARGHDRTHQARPVLPMRADERDQRLGLVDRRRGGSVAIEVGAEFGIVHRDPADQRAQAAPQADLGEQPGRREMNGAEHQRGRGARGKQIVDERRVDAASEVEIGVARFQREGEIGEPVFERAIERSAQLRILRRMDVQVDEPGQHDLVRGQPHEASRPFGFPDGVAMRGIARFDARGDRARLVDLDERVVEDLDRACHGRVTEPAEQGLAAYVIQLKPPWRPSHRTVTIGLYHRGTECGWFRLSGSARGEGVE